MQPVHQFLRRIRLLGFAFCLATNGAEVAAVPPDHAERMARGLRSFQEHIRPLLLEHCVKCHGGESTKAEFDLTTRESLLEGGADGPVVSLYDSGASRLLQLIQHRRDPPMPAKADKLPAEAIARVAAWIDDGAPYDEPLTDRGETASKTKSPISEDDRNWWSFRPLRGELPPALHDPAVQSPVDAFVLARLKSQGLALAPPADRRTLVRRASFDLLGIPPTPEQADAFLRDSAPTAWPDLVDRLLSRPEFGERWARHWLDVARFAESSGFEHDYDRPHAYHYRDFVIHAFNADLPFDQFVQWQIAGDEFAPEDPQALMATGFLGAGVFPTQITANEVERTRYDALDDMLATTSAAFLGLTVGCARCHDHKFDPIPTRDYYRMLSTFTTTVRSDIELDLEPEENRRAREEFDRQHQPLVAARAEYEQSELPAKFSAWLEAGAPLPPSVWQILSPREAKSQAGAEFRPLDDGSFLVEGKNGDSDVYTFVCDLPNSGARSLRLEALAHPSLVKGGPGRADNGNIGLSRIRVFASPLGGGPTNEVQLRQPRATFEQNTNQLSIASALDESPGTGWAVDPLFGTNHAAVFQLASPLDSAEGTRLTVQLEFQLNTRHNIGRPRLSVSPLLDPPLDAEGIPAEAAATLAKLRGEGNFGSALSASERDSLLRWWKKSEPGWQALHAKVEDHARQAPKPKLTKVLVCAEGYPALRMHTQGGDFLDQTHFLHRGSTDLKRDVVDQGFLRALLRDEDEAARWRWNPPEGARFSGRRRSLAQWMTDPEQGAGRLVARVAVNRLWQHLFGQGIVATPNDFGAQGAPPADPELLDWLAHRLIQEGWRLKPLLRLLMTSAVYQQSSAIQPRSASPPAAAATWQRHPRRLQAEAIRDSLLFVSGALDPAMGGPGTLDPASRRRSVYFTVKRSQLAPAMQAFDAPEPLVSQGTRPTTTVAPQALWLMNSPQVRTWAEDFARRFDLGPEQPLSASVERAYRLAFNRTPTALERSDACQFIEQQQSRYPADAYPRQNSLTDFAQVLLSLNEFIYVE